MTIFAAAFVCVADDNKTSLPDVNFIEAIIPEEAAGKAVLEELYKAKSGNFNWDAMWNKLKELSKIPVKKAQYGIPGKTIFL